MSSDRKGCVCRILGIVVVRGTSIVLVCPQDGTEEIENPYVDVAE